MSIESGADFNLGLRGRIGLELRIASLANAKERRECFDDAKCALCHDLSLSL